MEEIKKTMNANEFVSKLNRNFGESGGGASLVSRVIKMQMQGGKLVNGYPSGLVTTASDHFRYCHTILMMGIEGCAVTNVSTISGETLTVFCYDSNGAYLSSTSSLSDFPSGTCYVKFMVNKGSDYTYLRQLEISVTGKPTLHKNSIQSLSTPLHFSFEVTYPAYVETNNEGSETTGSTLAENTITASSPEGGYIGVNNTTRHYDNGSIVLPPNYSMDGAPVPLSLYIHGTGGFKFSSGLHSSQVALQPFIADNGYAVGSCSGTTNERPDIDNCFFAPSFNSCLSDLVKYLIANYNVCEDGVYIYGKSSAGFNLHLLTQQQGFKVKAAASFAPTVSLFSEIRYYWDVEPASTKFIYGQLGITAQSGTWDAYAKQLVLDNFPKFRMIDPFFAGVDLTDDEAKTVIQYGFENPTRAYRNSTSYRFDFTKISASTEAGRLLNSAKLYSFTPTKIWVAADDGSVSYNLAKFYVDMAKKTGSPVYLRQMPSGTGGHGSVDGIGASSAVTTTYQPKYSDGKEYISGKGKNVIYMAYAEMIDWFNRF